MTGGVPGLTVADPLTTLRQYASLAPWSLRDLTGLVGALLDASDVYPINPAARARPTERTIRFYVSRGLVSPPEGRGTAATYGYRHLLQVLAIKLQQMQGVTLEVLLKESAGLTGDVVERRVAAALGHRLPAPAQLSVPSPSAAARARAAAAAPAHPSGRPGRLWRRVTLGTGAELLLDERHPLFAAADDAALAAMFGRLIAEAAGQQ